jgi:hypothetical protein
MTGNAEFNNITARGEIVTSVFRKGQVIATSGSIFVTKSASILSEACTVASNTFFLRVKKQLGLAPFGVGEIIRIHGETTSVSTWAIIASVGQNFTDNWRYLCFYQGGSSSATYAVGCAVLGYGPTTVAVSGIPNAATATATTFTLDVNEIAGAKPLATGSYALLVEGGSSTVCTVDAGSDLGTYWRYTATYVSGSSSNLYDAGSGVYGLGATLPVEGRTMITSDAGNSPYISIATHAMQPWTTMTERARLGNLEGISGLTSPGYGLWTDNGFFTGTVNANAGSIGGWTIQSAYIAKDTGTNATSSGMAPGDFPFYAGRTYANRASAPFRVDTAGGLYATNGNVAGFVISYIEGLYSGAGATRVQMKAGAGFWAGATSIGDAPFRVTNAGALTATNVSITAGGGNATLNSNGLRLAYANTGTAYVSWYSGSTLKGYIGSFLDGSTNTMRINVQSSGTLDVAGTALVNLAGTTQVGNLRTNGGLAFFQTSGTGQSKQTVTGSRGGNAALASLLTALATYGLITDSTTA